MKENKNQLPQKNVFPLFDHLLDCGNISTLKCRIDYRLVKNNNFIAGSGKSAEPKNLKSNRFVEVTHFVSSHVLFFELC